MVFIDIYRVGCNILLSRGRANVGPVKEPCPFIGVIDSRAGRNSGSARGRDDIANVGGFHGIQAGASGAAGSSSLSRRGTGKAGAGGAQAGQTGVATASRSTAITLRAKATVGGTGSDSFDDRKFPSGTRAASRAGCCTAASARSTGTLGFIIRCRAAADVVIAAAG